MKKYNFNAGPSILPREVIENTAKQILDFNGSGLSLMEISHRAKDFQPVLDEAVALIKELLNVPEGYSVLFLGGGASLQFTQVPYNFLIKKAAYLNTGVWAKKALKEAKLYAKLWRWPLRQMPTTPLFPKTMLSLLTPITSISPPITPSMAPRFVASRILPYH